MADRPSAPGRVWNRIAPEVQDQIVEMALEQSELSPRELAVRFTDERQYFVSEATVYRLLKAHDLITSPAYVVIKAADQFHTKTTRVTETLMPLPAMAQTSTSVPPAVLLANHLKALKLPTFAREHEKVAFEACLLYTSPSPRD